MKELFLNYELSVLAKQHGFVEPCFARYIKKEFRFAALGGVTNFSGEQPNQISAPLFDQIIDWFMDKHKIFATVTYNPKQGFGGLIEYENGDFSLIEYNENKYTILKKIIQKAFEKI